MRPSALVSPRLRVEQSSHEMKGCRDGRSAKTSATRNCLYIYMVQLQGIPDDSPSFLARKVPKNDIGGESGDEMSYYAHSLQLHHIGTRFC